MFAAVIFDMDGVLVDSEIHWRKVGAEFLQTVVPNWSAEDQKSIHGMSLYQVHEFLVDKHHLELEKEAFVEKYQNLSAEIYTRHCSLIQGVIPCLEALSGDGQGEHAGILPKQLALASSAPRSWIAHVLQRFSLAQYFSVVVSSEEVTAKAKPAPDVYVEAIRRLGISPSEGIAVEDSKRGVASAKAAGLCCLGLRNGFNSQQNLAQADREIQSLDVLRSSFLQSLHSAYQP